MRKSSGALFPMFVDLEQREGLVIGGGKTAFGKVRHLIPWGPRIRIVAPSFCPQLLELCDDIGNAGRLPRPALIRRQFTQEDIRESLAFVVAASDDTQVNRLAASVCRKMRIPVNVVDVPEECTFFFPSLVQRGRLTVGISTGGASPSAAMYMRRKIEQIVPENIEVILDWLAERRSFVKEDLDTEEMRREAFHRLFLGCMEQGRPLTGKEEEEILETVRFRTADPWQDPFR